MLQEYTYHIIALIIIIFIYCITYPLAGSNLCDILKDNENKTTYDNVNFKKEYYESISFKNKIYIDSDTIAQFSENCARILAQNTFDKLVFPCMEKNNSDESLDIAKCIFKRSNDVTNAYFVYPPLAELYGNLKNFQGKYYEFSMNFNTMEETVFYEHMIDIWFASLRITLISIVDFYGSAGFNNQTFIEYMTMILSKFISDEIKKLYN